MQSASLQTNPVESLPVSVRINSQTKTMGPRYITYRGKPARISAKICYDDQCRNGYNVFSITGEIFDGTRGGGPSGCIHEEIAEHFPELAPLIKWHLTGSNGPMHYIANTIYHAGDQDFRGLRKGEKKQLKNGNTGLPVWEIVMRDSKGEKVDNFSSRSWVDSAEKPEEKFTVQFEPVWIEGEGKKRNLTGAKNSAVWPEVSDEELIRLSDSGELERALLNRLPALMAEFKTAMESLGFVY